MNKAFKKLLSLVFCLLIAVVFITGCNESFTDQGEVGKYYSFADSKTIVLDLNEGKFALDNASDKLSGSYFFDGSVLTLTFKGEKSSVVVDYKTNELTFQYQGTQYTLYRDVKYTVSFDTNGGSNVQSATVQNGAYVEAPAAPEKSGNHFMGWYADAAYKQAYDFEKVVTGDLTLYARFEQAQAGIEEFNVSFVSNASGVSFDDEKTFNGTLYNLPKVKVEGKKFLGWWVSDYEDASKLTYEFEEGMMIKQDTVLYAVYENQAPTVSVVNGKIEWDSKGVNKQYAVNVVDANDLTSEEIFTKRVTQTNVAFSFDEFVAGDYLVTVTCGDYTGKAYYKNKGLNQVCKFEVVNNKLTWNKVENATNYIVDIECGLAGHSHKDLSVGNVNEYDLSNCVMPSNGIKVTIQAECSGMVSSTSKVYNYYSELAEVKNIAVDEQKQVATWDAVEGASSYKVVIIADGKENQYTVEDNKIELSSFSGELNIKVVPQAACQYGKEQAYAYTKESLAAPANVKLLGYNVTWDEVKGAKSYVIKIGDKNFTSNTNVLSLTQAECEAISEFKISIQACAADAKNNSLFSKETVINKEGVNEINFHNGVISWNAVPGTLKYAVKVDDEKVIIVENATEVAYKIVSGKHTINVTVADNAGNYSDFYNVEVNVFALNFEVNGGKDIESVYFVKGDEIKNLPTTTQEGYSFVGWYNADETAFVAKEFNFEEDITVFAGWQGLKYKVIYDYTDLGVSQGENQEVVYGDDFKLVAPESTSLLKVFIGWFSELNGQGEQYTDQYGNSLRKWRDYQDITLYAEWADIFVFNPINNGKEYSVSKGTGISYVKEIKIPTEYEGLPVTTVEASGFASCSTLVRVQIPSSIKNVETGKMGPTGTGCCFQSCSKLEGVDVYEVEGVKEEDVKYFSIEGVLIHINEYNGIEIAFFPYGTKGGTYTIPSMVTTIPANCFKSCSKLEEIIIPATVEKIDDNAFYLCSKVTRITFLEAENPADEKELVLGNNVFQSNSVLETITLPNRLKSFNANIFTSCAKLQEILFEGSYSEFNYVSVDGVVFNADKTELIFFPRGKAGVYTVPVGVTKILESACETCKSITELNISGQVEYIGKNAFKSCTTLEKINFLGVTGDADLTIDESAFYGCTVLTEVTLPENLISMKKFAFGGTTKLVTVSVKATSKNIDYEACAFGSTAATPVYYVTTINLSKDVNVFDITAVFGSTKLVSVNVEDGNVNYKSVDGVLYDTGITRIIYYPTEKTGSYTLPNTITSIGDRVFQSKTGIDKITINKNVTEIGAFAFQSCTKLTEVIFEDGGTEELIIGESAFQGCSILETATLPNRVKAIPDACFKQCRKLQSMVIPASVTSIGSEAFYYCDMLTSMVIPAGVTKIVSATSTLTNDKDARVRAFDYCKGLTEFVVEAGNKNYQAIDGILYENVINQDTKEVESLILIASPIAKTGVAKLPNNISKIQNKAFYYNEKLEEVTFPNGSNTTYEVGTYAFYYCQALRKVELTGAKSIGLYAFYYCQDLEEVAIPNTCERVGSKAFYYCTSLSKVTFEEGGTEALVFDNGESSSSSSSVYYYSTFYNCPIEELILPERTTQIGNYCFTQLTELKKAYIPSTVTSAGTYLFYHCDKLENVVFGTNQEGKTGIKTLGTYMFNYCPIKSIVLPEGIESIGNYCFSYNKVMTSITIPSTVKTIGTSAFYTNANLETVTLSEGSKLETIGGSAFYGTAIKTFTFPQSITKIDSSAFSKCANLTSVTFIGSDTEQGSGLRTLGQNSFAYSGLTSFEFPYCGVDKDGKLNKLTIGTSTIKKVFNGCMNLESVTLSKSVLDISDLFTGCPVKNIILPDGHDNFKVDKDNPFILNAIGTAIILVYGHVSGELTIPEGYNEIGEYAFKNQSDLTKLNIPKSMKVIGKQAFANCLNLKEVNFAEGCLCDTFGDYVFLNCTSLKQIALPEALTKTSSYMFAHCTGLEKVTLSSKFVNLYTYTFFNCMSLKEIKYYGCTSEEPICFPSTFTTISNYAFKWCTSIERITIPATLAAGTAGFGIYSFQGCTGLKYVCISDGIKLVPNYAFDGCTGIEELYLGSNVETIGNYAFRNAGIKTLNIPASMKYLGTANSNSSTGYCFADCPNLEEVIIAENSALTAIGSYCFQNCSKLKSINLPDGILYLNTGAFKYCTSLESIDFGSKLITIGTTGSSAGVGVFEGCVGIKSITLPKTLTTIGAYAFQGTNIEEVTIPEKVTTLSAYAFSDCKLKKVVIDKANVTTWGSNAFANNPDLTEVDLGTKLTKLGAYIFDNCTSLEEITLPSTLVIVNVSATGTTAQGFFRGCTALNKVTFKANITSLGGNAFENCTALETISIPATCAFIGNNCFKGCTALKEIAIPAACTKLGSAATTGSTFEGCTSLSKVTFSGTKLVQVYGFVFKDCTSLKEIKLPTSVTTLGQNIFQNSGVTSFEIGSKVATITAPFNEAPNLKTLTVNAGNTKFAIYENVAVVDKAGKIYSCLAGDLGDFTLPEGTTINNYAFQGCSFKTLTLPESLITVNGYAFQGIKAEKVVLGSKVTNVAGYAFKNAVIDQLDFGTCDKTITGNAFNGATVKEFINSTSIATLSANAFNSCKGFTTFEFGPKVTKIGYGAFYSTDLEEINIPEGVTEITTTTSNAYATFGNCLNLKKVTLPSTLVTFGAYAFYKSGITEIVVPEGATFVGGYQFSGCANLKKASISNSTFSASLGHFMFENCTALEEIILPEGMTSTATNMFVGCSSLKSIEFPSTLATIQTNAFKGCDLREVKLPASIVNVFAGAFENNVNLTKVELNEGLVALGTIPSTYGTGTTSGDGAFQGCTSLSSIEIPQSCLTLGEYTFKGCTSLKSIYIHEDVLYLGAECFGGWTKDQVVNIAVEEYQTVGQYFRTEAATYNCWNFNTEATINYGVQKNK